MFLVFDFDGTLADTSVPFREAFDDAARTMHTSPFRQQDEAYLRTLEASDLLRAHGVASEQFAAFIHLVKQGMESRHAKVSLAPGVAEALDELNQRGTPMGLISSNSGELVGSVLAERMKFFRYQRFDVSLTGKEAALASAALECSSFGSLRYIGDEIRDFRAASAAKVKFSAVTWGYNTEEALREEGCKSFIRSPAELVGGSDNHTEMVPSRTSFFN